MVVRLSTPGEVAASLPGLLGYHAENSIVLLLLGGPRRRLLLTLRLDLPEQRDDIAWRAVWQAFEPGVRQARANEAIVVVVDGDERDAMGLATVLRDGLDEQGVDMRDVLLVADGRYRSVLCRDASCCPPEGRHVRAIGAVTVAKVTQGEVIASSRDELRAELAPPDPEAAQRAEAVWALMAATIIHGSMDDPADEFDAYLDAACAACDDGDLPLDRAVRLAFLVSMGEWRDDAYLHMVRTDVRAHRRVWASVCRQLPPQRTVVPHVLLALAAYLDGAGALASVAVEAAEAIDAEHPSVTLLSDILAAGIPPRDVRAALAKSMVARR